MKRFKSKWLCALGLIALLAGCSKQSSEPTSTTPLSISVTDYQPLVYEDPSKQTTESNEKSGVTAFTVQNLPISPSHTPQTSGAQTLDSIASDLNLSASARRQCR